MQNEKKKKTHVVTIRLTEDQYQELIEKSEKKNMSVSKYIRRKLQLVD